MPSLGLAGGNERDASRAGRAGHEHRSVGIAVCRGAGARDAWQRGRIVPVVCHETVTELLRVLAYPKFKLSRSDQEELLADFLPYAEIVVIQDPPSNLPVCRDPANQIFLVLARQAEVCALVTGDADLLALRGACAIHILTTQEFRARLR